MLVIAWRAGELGSWGLEWRVWRWWSVGVCGVLEWWSVRGAEFWALSFGGISSQTIGLMTASDVIQILDLKPHPEGGHYRETLRDPMSHAGRAVSTAIYFLLAAGEVSHWHRIDSTEVWHWYGGAALALAISHGDDVFSVHVGMDLTSGERPQAIVPAGAWQSARTLGAWTLVGCTVAPAFLFEHFELAPPGWEPGKQL